MIIAQVEIRASLGTCSVDDRCQNPGKEMSGKSVTARPRHAADSWRELFKTRGARPRGERGMERYGGLAWTGACRFSRVGERSSI